MNCADIDRDECCERCHMDVADYICAACSKWICTTCGSLWFPDKALCRQCEPHESEAAA